VIEAGAGLSFLKRSLKFLTNRITLFFIGGLLLFVADHVTRDRDELIRVGPAEMEMLEARWLAQTGTLATPSERRALVDSFIEEEVLSREAIRLGLDQGDTIIRRRLAQKMKLILREQVPDAPIEAAEIRAFIDQNPDLFLVPKRVAFRQVFLGPEPPEGAAGQVLARLAADASEEVWRQAGRASMAPSQLGLSSEVEISELFGPDFAAGVLVRSAEVGWWGPLRSAYGVHLVAISAAEEEHIPEFERLRSRAEAMLRRQRTEAAEREAWTELLSRYTIEMDVSDP
jgi:hypothetical protein